jgi:hypothetical protein
MKYLIILLFSISFFVTSCDETHTTDSNNFKIIDITNDINMISDERDVSIINSNEPIDGFDMDNYYIVKIMYDGYDSIETATVFFGDSDIYDKARYTWITDTSISLTLFHSISDKYSTFRVSGRMDGSGSGSNWD